LLGGLEEEEEDEEEQEEEEAWLSMPNGICSCSCSADHQREHSAVETQSQQHAISR